MRYWVIGSNDGVVYGKEKVLILFCMMCFELRSD